MHGQRAFGCHVVRIQAALRWACAQCTRTRPVKWGTIPPCKARVYLKPTAPSTHKRAHVCMSCVAHSPTSHSILPRLLAICLQQSLLGSTQPTCDPESHKNASAKKPSLGGGSPWVPVALQQCLPLVQSLHERAMQRSPCKISNCCSATGCWFTRPGGLLLRPGSLQASWKFSKLKTLPPESTHVLYCVADARGGRGLGVWAGGLVS